MGYQRGPNGSTLGSAAPKSEAPLILVADDVPGRLAVAAHGGRIWVEDTPGTESGSAFPVVLPLEPPRRTAGAPRPA